MIFTIKQNTPIQVKQKMIDFIAPQKDTLNIQQARKNIAYIALLEFYKIDMQYLCNQVFPYIDKWLPQQFCGYIYESISKPKPFNMKNILIDIQNINFGNLYSLHISDNNITNIQALNYLNLQTVKHLDISNNNITSFKSLSKLYQLNSGFSLAIYENPMNIDDFYWLARMYFNCYKRQYEIKINNKQFQLCLYLQILMDENDQQNYDRYYRLRGIYQPLFKVQILCLKNINLLIPCANDNGPFQKLYQRF